MFVPSGHVVSDQLASGGLACSWLVGVGYGLRLSVCYLGVVRLSEGLFMLGRGLFRRLVVLVVLTLVTAVVVPGVMAPSASANGCGGFTFEVADIDELYDAIS